MFDKSEKALAKMMCKSFFYGYRNENQFVILKNALPFYKLLRYRRDTKRL